MSTAQGTTFYSKDHVVRRLSPPYPSYGKVKTQNLFENVRSTYAFYRSENYQQPCTSLKKFLAKLDEAKRQKSLVIRKQASDNSNSTIIRNRGQRSPEDKVQVTANSNRNSKMSRVYKTPENLNSNKQESSHIRRVILNLKSEECYNKKTQVRNSTQANITATQQGLLILKNSSKNQNSNQINQQLARKKSKTIESQKRTAPLQVSQTITLKNHKQHPFLQLSTCDIVGQLQRRKGLIYRRKGSTDKTWHHHKGLDLSFAEPRPKTSSHIIGVRRFSDPRPMTAGLVEGYSNLSVNSLSKQFCQVTPSFAKTEALAGSSAKAQYKLGKSQEGSSLIPRFKTEGVQAATSVKQESSQPKIYIPKLWKGLKSLKGKKNSAYLAQLTGNSRFVDSIVLMKPTIKKE